MNKKSIKLNYLYNVAYQMLLIIIPFITLPYLTRVLGADGIGLFSFAESIISYFTLFANLGINIYGQREISYVQDNIKKRSEVFYNTILLKFIITILVIFLYLFFCKNFFKEPIYIVLIVNLLATLFDISWFFQGIEEFGKIVSINIIFRIIQVISIFILVKSNDHVVLYTLIYSLAPFISNLFLFIFLNKYITDIKINKLRPFKGLPIAFSLFIPTIAIQIYTVLDKTMIGIITNENAENGYYELAIKSSKMILTLVTALSTVVVPRIGLYFEKRNKKMIQKLMYKSYEFVWFLSIPLCLGLYALSINFVPWYFGAGYDKTITLLKILSFLIIIIGLSNVTGIQYLLPTKRQNKLTLSVCIGACVNFILNMILIRHFKSIGAAIASIIAETAITYIQFFIVRKEINIYNVLLLAKNYLISGIIMFVVLILLSRILITNWISTLIMIIIGAIIYFTSLFLLTKRHILDTFKF